MDLRTRRTRCPRFGALVFAVATISRTLVSSGVALVPAASSTTAADARLVRAAGSASSKVAALVPASTGYTSIFTPLVILPATVKASSSKQAAAFAGLNALIRMENRFSDDISGCEYRSTGLKPQPLVVWGSGLCDRRTPAPNMPLGPRRCSGRSPPCTLPWCGPLWPTR
jgi:hypothetical protein